MSGAMPEEHYAPPCGCTEERRCPEHETRRVLPVVDDPPGAWADEHPVPTAEEIAAGNALGQTIDVDDDENNGLDLSGAVSDTLTYPVARGYEHGLRCMDCDRVIPEGAPYAQRLYGFAEPMVVDDDEPTECVELVCVYCSMEPGP